MSDNLEKQYVSAKFVTRLKNPDQMEIRQLIMADCFEKSKEDTTFLETIITGDETWVYTYDLETKMQLHNGTQLSSTKEITSCHNEFVQVDKLLMDRASFEKTEEGNSKITSRQMARRMVTASW